MAQTNYTPLTWSIALLKRLGDPVNHQTVQAVLGWVNAEGGQWHNDARFNPLNTTQNMPGAGNTGTQGNIKQYSSWDQGLDATVKTLQNGLYKGILGALKQGTSANAVGSAITNSPWGTGGLAARVISQTKVPANLPNVNVQPVAPTTAATSPAHTNAPATSRTVTTDPNQAARGAAIRSFLFDRSIQPVDFASQVSQLQPITTTVKIPNAPTVNQPNRNPQVQPQTSSVGGRAAGAKPGDPVLDGTGIGGTHQTDGLPGFPARDYFAPAGSPAVAPVSGTIIRFSGHDPKLGAVQGAGGPLGWSIYLKGSDGKTYFLTHLGSRTVAVGQTVTQGQKIGTVANYDKYGRPSHIHMGVHG